MAFERSLCNCDYAEFVEVNRYRCRITDEEASSKSQLGCTEEQKQKCAGMWSWSHISPLKFSSERHSSSRSRGYRDGDVGTDPVKIFEDNRFPD